ncbi:TIGR00269 family protein [Acetomicrobium flavidum]|uniref:TIGR00269 family protein n=1 Tax=Acetomicrobium flavidum TaxID=49896 RepID=A0ABY1JAS5_9BACT|nr:TIGR00269 family protein [Acetomicrobium flavidum]
MKCRICRAKAIISLPQHNLALCAEHFDAWMLKRVTKAIEEFGMFSKEDKILVAVSGGKDSLALWDILLRLGYDSSGLYINLGIKEGDYSDESERLTTAFANRANAKLYVVNIEQLHGMSIPDKAYTKKRKTCSLCGVTKRYYMNKIARDMGFDVIATGHNLDDQAAALLGNMLFWKMDYLAKGAPYSPPMKAGEFAKAKPMVYCTEKEDTVYCLLRGIAYIERECPYSKGATSLRWKRALFEMEESSPGAKQAFYFGYVKNIDLFAGKDEKEDVPPLTCRVCGTPSWNEVCSFCSTWDLHVDEI